MSNRKTVLTLEQKIEVIELMKKEKLSVRKVATIFNIGKTQAAQIYKNREDLLFKWQNGVNPAKKRCFKSSDGLKIDQKCLDWYTKATSENVPISGELIKAKARDFARELNATNFCASNGWLEKWRKRNSLTAKSNSGDPLAAVRPKGTKITTIDEALNAIKDLKVFAISDYEAYEHVKWLEMYYESRILKEKIQKK